MTTALKACTGQCLYLLIVLVFVTANQRLTARVTSFEFYAEGIQTVYWYSGPDETQVRTLQVIVDSVDQEHLRHVYLRSAAPVVDTAKWIISEDQVVYASDGNNGFGMWYSFNDSVGTKYHTSRSMYRMYLGEVPIEILGGIRLVRRFAVYSLTDEDDTTSAQLRTYEFVADSFGVVLVKSAELNLTEYKVAGVIVDGSYYGDPISSVESSNPTAASVKTTCIAVPQNDCVASIMFTSPMCILSVYNTLGECVLYRRIDKIDTAEIMIKFNELGICKSGTYYLSLKDAHTGTVKVVKVLIS